MYSTQMDESYGHESSFDTRFNGVRIDDIDEFYEEYREKFAEILNLSHKHTQSIALDFPNTVSKFLSEGTLVTLTEMGEYEYIGIVDEVADPESYDGRMILDDEDELLSITLLCQYDKSQSDNLHFDTVSQDELDYIYPETVDILLEKFGKSVLNYDMELDILCVISDDYISEIVEDDQVRVCLEL